VTVNNFRPFVIADPLYYDRIDRAALSDDLYRRLLERAADRAPVDLMGIWSRCMPTPIEQLPDHGWKLHVSARPADACAVLDAVLDAFDEEPFSFKCVRSSELVLSQLSRWWPRGGAGKAMAFYPTSLEHARELAERLSKRLATFDGPHILTNRRFPGSQNVQYRYGTFRRPKGVDAEGRQRTDIVGPDGSSWQDDRKPSFSMPPWIESDPFESPGPAQPTTDFLRRYRVSGPLHQSTAGGVYLATTADGTEVVLKEARPNTAFAPDGTDAVQRMHREYEYLRLLSGSGVTPEPIELTEVWEHTFLVESKVPGVTLQVWVARNHPLAQGFDDPAKLESYRRRLGGLLEQLRSALRLCRERGVLYGDVSMANILVDDDDTLRLIDLEGGRPVDADPSLYPRTSGYAPLEGSPAWQSDEGFIEFAVAAVEASCLVNRNALLGLDPVLFGRSLRHTAARLDWPTRRLLSTLDRGAPGVDSAPTAAPAMTELIDGICRHIRAAATPDRRDRLFPAQPDLFSTNPFSLAHGAAGVLRALRVLDGGIDQDHLGWLVRGLDAADRLPAGLYHGRAGIGLCLVELGEEERGRAELRTALAMAADTALPADVATGAAGIALAALALAGNDPDSPWLAAAARLGDRLAGQAEDDGSGLWWPTSGKAAQHPLGYLYGSAGVATFLLELSRRTGEVRFGMLARRALQFDLSRGRVRANGGLGFGPTATAVPFEPYYVRGGAGVGMALARAVALTGDPALLEALRSTVVGIGMGFSVNPGLLVGMSGIAEFLLDSRDVATDPETTDRIDTTVADLVGEIVALRFDHADGVAYPGDALVRLSCDIAGGSAGVGLVLKRLVDGGPTLDVRYGRLATDRDR